MRTVAKAMTLVAVAAILAGCAAEDRKVITGGIPALDLVRRDDIRAVYQIKTSGMKHGVGAALHYVRKLLDTYNGIGIPDRAAEVHAVFHGDAAHWMLRDPAFARACDLGDTNPNKAIIAELVRRGVSLELCAQTMRSHNWRPEDVLPGVKIVVGAYPRIIDLQQRGCAYIRF